MRLVMYTSPLAHVRACLHSALESSSQVIMLLYKMCIKLYTSQNWKPWATDLPQTITLKQKAYQLTFVLIIKICDYHEKRLDVLIKLANNNVNPSIDRIISKYLINPRKCSSKTYHFKV